MDRRSAEQQRFTNIVTNTKYPNSGTSKLILTNFKTWTNSADYLIFWSKRVPKNNISKIVLEMDEVIDKVAKQRTDFVRQLVMNNPANEGAVLEGGAVAEDNAVAKDDAVANDDCQIKVKTKPF